MKNPIQSVKNILSISTASNQHVCTSVSKIMNGDALTSIVTADKGDESALDKAFRIKRKIWLNHVDDLLELIKVDFNNFYYLGKVIHFHTETKSYNDPFIGESYEAPILEIRVNKETFELSPAAGLIIQKDYYYSLFRQSNYNGKHAKFYMGRNDIWSYSLANEDLHWKPYSEDKFNYILKFIQ